MRHVKIIWTHNETSDPNIMFYEISENNEILRQVELFSDGSYGFANSAMERHSFITNDIPFPSNEEINSELDLHAFDIDRERFEVIWTRAESSVSAA